MSNLQHHCGDNDEPEQDPFVPFYHKIMSGLSTGLIIPPKTQALIDDFKPVELPVSGPFVIIQIRNKKML